jgi:HlyD family secretion protein
MRFLAAALALVCLGCGAKERPREVVTETVSRGSIASTVTATGTVNPVAQVQVGTYVSGRIEAIYADFNSRVKAGQVIARIDPRPVQVKVDQARANLVAARARVAKDRADLELRSRTLARVRRLFEENLVAESEVDAATSAYEQARSQLEADEAAVRQAEAALREAEVNLGYTRIVSPVDGIVVSRNVDVGQTVAASFQTPVLFLIAEDLARMQVNANVSESDIGQIREGQEASFTVDAYPGRSFRGRVVQARNAPIRVLNVVTYDVVIAVDNPDLALKPGMTATVTIATAEREGVLKVPLRALRFRPDDESLPPAPPRPGRSTVWVLRDGTLSPVAIETGVRNDEETEVVSGELAEGDRVAVAYRGRASGPVPSPPPFAARRFR